MKTAFLLMAQYDGLAVIPLATVCKDYFRHLSPDNLTKKIVSGEIKLPLLRVEDGQKSAKGVHLTDLADYLDARAEMARRELYQMTRPFGGAGVTAQLSAQYGTAHLSAP